MTARLRAANCIAFDGQSLVTTPGTALAFPAKVMPSRPGDIGPVVAMPGTGWVERTANAARRVDERYLNSVSGQRIYVDCGGTFDVNFGYPAASIIANAEANWAARRAAGWGFVIATTIPDSVGFDATKDATRAAVNEAIRSSLELDAFVDLAAILVDGVEVCEDASLADWWDPDGVHWRATLTPHVADAVLAVL